MIQPRIIYPHPAPRLDEYFSAPQLPRITTDLTSGDDDRAFLALEAALWGGWGSPCLQGEPADLDDATPGLQYDCAMTADVGGEPRTIPACERPASVERLDSATREPSAACWSLREDPWSCFFDGHRPGLALHLSGYTDFTHPAYRFECRTR